MTSPTVLKLGESNQSSMQRITIETKHFRRMLFNVGSWYPSRDFFSFIGTNIFKAFLTLFRQILQILSKTFFNEVSNHLFI